MSVILMYLNCCTYHTGLLSMQTFCLSGKWSRIDPLSIRKVVQNWHTLIQNSCTLDKGQIKQLSRSLKGQISVTPSYIVSKIWSKVANFIDGNCQFPVMEKDKDHICTDAIHNQPVVANNSYCCHANQMHWTNFMLSA